MVWGGRGLVHPRTSIGGGARRIQVPAPRGRRRRWEGPERSGVPRTPHTTPLKKRGQLTFESATFFVISGAVEKSNLLSVHLPNPVVYGMASCQTAAPGCLFCAPQQGSRCTDPGFGPSVHRTLPKCALEPFPRWVPVRQFGERAGAIVNSGAPPASAGRITVTQLVEIQSNA